MQKFQIVWLYLQRHRLASILLAHVCVLVVMATLFLGSGWSSGVLGVFAQSHCASGDQVYMVKHGDTLGGIAAHYHVGWQHLAQYNHISDPNTIYAGETVCIPGGSARQPVKGTGNYFPPGQCTWWANQRYHQLHGVYVPWLSQSDAWQWTARAHQFYWRVSSKPSPGAIIDLQPWIQGAYGFGHVAVVEKILPDGRVIASNLNWGARPDRITNVEFTPGPGVTFISF